MQNGANFVPDSGNVVGANLTTAKATIYNTETNTKFQLFTGNELGEASTNAFESCDYANRNNNNNSNNNSLSLEKKNSDDDDDDDDKADTDIDTDDDIIEVRKIKYNDLDEKFVVHHVVREDCCNCSCGLQVKKKRNKFKEKEENLFYLIGVNSRCNCSGRRRSTLSGLIELFEQKLQLEEPISCSKDSPSEPLSARERLVSSKQRQRKQQQAVDDCSNRELGKYKQQKQSDRKMRDIITPVKYQATTSSNSSTESDSTEFEFVQKGQNTDERCNHDDHATDSPNKSLHHVAAKGVPVLPKPNVQKLTKTRWQPPTDGRQYEQRCPTPSSYLPPHHSKASSLKTRFNVNEGLEVSEYTSDSSQSSQKEQQQQSQEQGRESVSSNFRRARVVANRKQRVGGGSTSASLAATRGPQIVKHQPTSSRRLLNQLARIRRLNEPHYRVKRPEKVVEVEKLIERLEKATADWEEDEHLLDRAELRDWPPEYHKRFSNQKQEGEEEEEGEENQPSPTNRLNEDVQEQDSIEDFGCRLDVNPLEQDTITRSHYYNMMTASYLNKQLQSTSANSTLTNRASRRSRAFADRYLDDLAVRRLSCGKLSSSFNTPSSSSSSVMQTFNQQPQMSYLLCSNAYTPSINTNIFSAYETLDQRAKIDDLHFRYVKNRPESHEPPFGIPRQLTNAASHSSASHYLRRQENLRRPEATTTCASCVCGNNYRLVTNGNNNNSNTNYNDNEEFYDQINSKRSDSKVSFNDKVDRAGGSTSVDSGVAASSPYSNGRQSSATSRLTPAPSPLAADSSTNYRRFKAKSPRQETPIEQYVYEDDVTQEVDLDEVLTKESYQQPSQPGFELEYDQSVCESPLLERYKAEIKATPIRRRPKINIENPRAKSPLLRIAPKEIRPSGKLTNSDNISCLTEQQPRVEIQCYSDKQGRPSRKSTSELECKYDFQDDEDDEDNEDNDEKEDGEEEKGEDLVKKRASHIVNTNYETSDSSLVNETPSNIHLNYRGEESRTNVDTQSKLQRQDKSGPSFSIGEYKPLNKPNLKIL